jgi:hypothetical protein
MKPVNNNFKKNSTQKLWVHADRIYRVSNCHSDLDALMTYDLGAIRDFQVNYIDSRNHVIHRFAEGCSVCYPTLERPICQIITKLPGHFVTVFEADIKLIKISLATEAASESSTVLRSPTKKCIV